jgi:hypothetical protein
LPLLPHEKKTHFFFIFSFHFSFLLFYFQFSEFPLVKPPCPFFLRLLFVQLSPPFLILPKPFIISPFPQTPSPGSLLSLLFFSPFPLDLTYHSPHTSSHLFPYSSVLGSLLHRQIIFDRPLLPLGLIDRNPCGD